MHCLTVNDSFQEIEAYCNGEAWGYPLLVNTENYNDFQEILQRLEVDPNKRCIFVSQHTSQKGLPIIVDTISEIMNQSNGVLVGISQALMLRGKDSLNETIDELLELSISGHAIVLLSHCKGHLEKRIQRDPRCARRIVMIDGAKSPLPQIRLTENAALCVGFKPLNGIPDLLSHLERMHDAEEDVPRTFTVLTGFKPSMFSKALYDVAESKGIFEAICQRYPDLVLLNEEYGTEEQWNWLFQKMEKASSFSEYVCETFGTTDNLIIHLSSILESGDKKRAWLLWIALKLFGVKGNAYLTSVLETCEHYEDLEQSIYNGLLNLKWTDPRFASYYSERKHIIEALPENIVCVNAYCNQIGHFGKYAGYYLTPSSERERFELMQSLSTNEYSEREISEMLKLGFYDLDCYMKPFVFDAVNTKLTAQDDALRKEFTAYFDQYKLQKLTNRINKAHLKKVEEYAIVRPYTKLQPRSSFVTKLKHEKNTGFFIFDALGIEYLSYIQTQCERYGLVAEVDIARCEIPSITAANKEFENTGITLKKILALDELKHHSADYDYTLCQYPIHLFKELEIINTELKKIQSKLAQGIIQKAVILSDHGASRLAVLYGKEHDSIIEMDEKGIHSGRCCKIAEDPKLPQVTYEDGYAVLANYERFKGGRKANLEVHGGATLEEMLVPVITLTRRPNDIVYYFVDPVIQFKLGQAPKIELYCNVPMEQPKILVNGIFYEGSFVGDKKKAAFTMPELKRADDYEAIVYDGEKNIGITLSFRIERKTKQRNLGL